MNIIDRFSNHLRETLGRALRVAAELRHKTVDPIHLLYALSMQKGSLAAEILTRFKCAPQSIEPALFTLPAEQTALPENTPITQQLQFAPLSNASKTILEKAMIEAEQNRHNFIGTEHLLFAIVQFGDILVEAIFKRNDIDADELLMQAANALGNACQFPNIAEAAEMADKLQEMLPEQIGQEITQNIPVMNRLKNKRESALEFFAANLTSRETQKNIDPVVGRDNEIERLIHVICRRTKNNPVLLGEPGVGKTAIVEGLAKKIADGKVPDMLLSKKIYALDMGLLIAGAIYRGEFEGRLRQVIDEIIRDPNIILFIDELHNIIGAGSNQGTMDAANLLKPVLARGQLRCIGATTPQEFKKHIEHDAALERRFQPIYVKESTVEDTIKILRGISGNYEDYHKVKIMDDALEAAARLADKYVSNKYLPDKAIDLLDETAAAKRLSVKCASSESKLARLARRLEKITQDKEIAALGDQFDKAVKLKEEENKLKAEMAKYKMSAKNRKGGTKALGTVTAEDVAAQLTKILGAPPSGLALTNQEKIADVEKELKKRIIGQDGVIWDVSQLIVQAQLGISHPERPLASFLFVGESGVGKTELAKTLAKILYPGQEALVSLNMSEFSEGFGVSKLLGSPAGYVGYRESNQFTDKIKMRPYCVVLFDEIDKAHRDVVKLLLQMLESGEINDSTGKKISLRHAILILTTTYGADEVKKSAIGFGEEKNNKQDANQRMIEKLKEHFSPELINRLDKICLFNSLDRSDYAKIAELELNDLNKRLEQYRTRVIADQEILEWIVAQLPVKQINAREVRQKIRNDVERLLSEIILKEKVKASYRLTIEEERLRAR